MPRPQKYLITRVTCVDGKKREVTILAVPFTGDRLSVEMELEDCGHRRGHRIEFLGEAMSVIVVSSPSEALELI